MEVNNANIIKEAIKEAIKELPPPERAVAIALKHIFDQIKETNRKEQEQIDASHQSFISRFKVLEAKTSDIIKGRPIKQEELKKGQDQGLIQQNERGQLKKLISNSAQHKIPQYWLKCLQNSIYKQELSDQDALLLKYVSDIRTNVTTTNLELIITIDKNEFISDGTFTRRLVLEAGIPSKFEGQEPQWKVQKQDGVFGSFVFVNTNSPEDLTTVLDIISNLINEIIPYSLQYYLGAVEHNDEGEADDDEQNDEDEEDIQEENDTDKKQ